MGSTRLRYTMIGFIAGVLLMYMLQNSSVGTGTRFALPVYGVGIGLLIDGMILRVKQRKGKDE
ncbi:hypothetical protein ACI7RC_24745 [Brevibacillus sp. B_LB10_24]|uniref:hypothetical protein n=1 Tax=Brevibacillus sp. B_LB10_24 TaxID=3380645 RepID=UPI0038BBF1DE